MKSVSYQWKNCSLFYLYVRKHICLHCNNPLKTQWRSETLNACSPEADKYETHMGDTYMLGDVDFRTPYFLCTCCNTEFEVAHIQKFEKTGKE